MGTETQLTPTETAEDVCFCVRCGGENAPGARSCAVCGRDPDPEEHPFRDFFVKHTKDRLKDEAEDRLYEAVKSWLLSHLYGAALTVTVVAAAAAAIASAPPNIPNVTERPAALEAAPFPAEAAAQVSGMAAPAETETAETADPWAEDAAALYALSLQFERAIMLDDFDSFWLPAEFGYPRNDALNLRDFIARADAAAPSENTRDFSFRDPEEFQGSLSILSSPGEAATETGRKLLSDGYAVAEFPVTLEASYMPMEFGHGGQIIFDGAPKTVLYTETYLLICAKYEGAWYLAENIRVS